MGFGQELKPASEALDFPAISAHLQRTTASGPMRQFLRTDPMPQKGSNAVIRCI